MRILYASEYPWFTRKRFDEPRSKMDVSSSATHAAGKGTLTIFGIRPDTRC
jgi:hypothetical protein